MGGITSIFKKPKADKVDYQAESDKKAEEEKKKQQQLAASATGRRALNSPITGSLGAVLEKL